MGAATNSTTLVALVPGDSVMCQSVGSDKDVYRYYPEGLRKYGSPELAATWNPTWDQAIHPIDCTDQTTYLNWMPPAIRLSVKCSNNSDQGNDPSRVYRAITIQELRPYPTRAVFSSWGAEATSIFTIDCNLFDINEPLPELTGGQLVSCVWSDTSEIYIYHASGLIPYQGSITEASDVVPIDCTGKLSFQARQKVHIDSALLETSQSDPRINLIYQAKRGLELNVSALDSLVASIVDNETADFELVKLIRIMAYTSQYNDRILPTIRTIPLWLTANEPLRCYWSENHMIMWTSTAFLLRETIQDYPVDENLLLRLTTYLDAKIAHGFYEYFSNVYAPLTLSGLLNLADFSKDETIKTKAEQAIARFLHELLLATNERGYFVASQGRTDLALLRSGYLPTISLLTGLGKLPVQSSFQTAFLATTDMDLSAIIASWTPNIDTTIQMGHPLDQASELFAQLPRSERVIFQWSFGGYFHSSFIEDTVWLVNEYDLREHETWAKVMIMSSRRDALLISLAKRFQGISHSSVLTGVRVSIYRNGPSSLSSSQDYFGGYVGWQQSPIVASTGTSPVFLLSGNPGALGTQNQNSHLPKVFQKSHVALILYNQLRSVRKADKFQVVDLDPTVNLHWDEANYTEVIERNHWKIAREGDLGYIGIRRGCLKNSCQKQPAHQAWAMIVGNAQTHGSFGQFVSVIEQSVFTESVRIVSRDFTSEIRIDGITISHSWPTEFHQ